jgi:hypothetical protein
MNAIDLDEDDAESIAREINRQPHKTHDSALDAAHTMAHFLRQDWEALHD